MNSSKYLCILAALMLAGCTEGDICNSANIIYQKDKLECAKQPGCGLTGSQYSKARDAQRAYPQCWNEGVER